MYWKGIVHELLWFLRGDTNIKYLVDNDVNIWNGDAYRWYLTRCERNGYPIAYQTEESFVEAVKAGPIPGPGDSDLYTLGDLGKVYGYQWRNQNGVDQIRDVFNSLKTSPYSRYHIVDSWNKRDFPEMALPPCHLLYQFICKPLSESQRRNLLREAVGPKFEFNTAWKNLDWEVIERQFDVPKFQLDLNMYQRSCDTFLGVPFNLASMAVFQTIMAKAANMVPGVAFWVGGDTHIYVDHLDAVWTQLERTPTELPKLRLNAEIRNFEDIMNLKVEDFELIGYEPQARIRAELFAGVKK